MLSSYLRHRVASHGKATDRLGCGSMTSFGNYFWASQDIQKASRHLQVTQSWSPPPFLSSSHNFGTIFTRALDKQESQIPVNSISSHIYSKSMLNMVFISKPIFFAALLFAPALGAPLARAMKVRDVEARVNGLSEIERYGESLIKS